MPFGQKRKEMFLKSNKIRVFLNQFEKKLKKETANFGQKNRLRDACEYSLFTGGRRVRPLIVFLLAQALNKNRDVMHAAIAAELFHTASLIADDLPCMDNDQQRRNKPTTHVVFGESTALLASYTLIAEGYKNLHTAGKVLGSDCKEAQEATLKAIYLASKLAGMEGASGGQFLDLEAKEADFESIKEIFIKKTASVFEVTFAFGFLFGGGELESLSEVLICARHFGLAFQLLDDAQDRVQDSEQDRNVFETKEAPFLFDWFREECLSFEKKMEALSLLTPPLLHMLQKLRSQMEEAEKQVQTSSFVS